MSAQTSERLTPVLTSVALALVVLAGVAGYVRNARVTGGMAAPAVGANWITVNRDGEPLLLGRGGKLALERTERVEISPLAGATHSRSVRVLGLRQTAHAAFEVEFGSPDTTRYVIRIAAPSGGGVTVTKVSRSGERTFPKIEATDVEITGYARLQSVTVEASAEALRVLIDDRIAARAAIDEPLPVPVAISARSGPLRIDRFSAEFSGGANPNRVEADFIAGDADRVGILTILKTARLPVAALLFALLWMRSLCFGRPPVRAVMQATGILVAAPCLHMAVGLMRPLTVSPTVMIALGLIGFFPAAFRLRHYLPPGPQPRSVALLTALVLFATAASTVDYENRLRAEERRVEQEGFALPVAAATERFAPIQLGPHNSLVSRSLTRGVKVQTQASIAAESALQVRVRASDEGTPIGLCLIISTDPGFRGGFYQETRDKFLPIGPSLDVVSADRPLDVELTAIGRTLRATVDGRSIETTSRLFPRGYTAVLTAVGEARLLGETSIDPIADDGGAPDTRIVDAARAAAWPVVFAIVLGLALAGFARAPRSAAMLAVATGLLPFAYLMATHDPVGPLRAATVAPALFASGLVLLLTIGMHARGMRTMAFLALVGIVLAGEVSAMRLVRERAWPATHVAVSQLSFADWDVDPLDERFLHVQHPRLRRWNEYLADHRFRGRPVTLAKPNGRKRILVLGTSSSYGYLAKKPYGFWLEDRLRAAGVDVEVIVGAVAGGGAVQQYYLLRHAYLDFSPDIVTLSLTFNDSRGMSQIDEFAYVREILSPSHRLSWLNGIRTRMRMTVEGNAYLAAQRSETVDSSPYPDGDDPPARFKRGLTGFADLGREHGFELVLIKEPNLGHRPWKDEFFRVIDEVAAEYGLKVADPGRHLPPDAEGLFKDAVHPTDEGHQRIADLLLPTLRRALRD